MILSYWVKSSDQLPEEGQFVLIWLIKDKEFVVTKYCEGNFFSHTWNSYSNVKWWMPLSPPEENEKKWRKNEKKLEINSEIGYN